MSTQRRVYVMHLPSDWTVEQALAIHDLLTDLAEVIWQQYEDPISDFLHGEYGPIEEQPDLFDFDDPIPF